jgi:pimeloyl-ACP methyl ester carboxylesterase
MPFVEAAGHRLEYELVETPGSNRGGAPGQVVHRADTQRDPRWVVFLHEGLGSISMWRDFPQRICVATGLRGLVYSRHGYGKSSALDWANEPRSVGFMHDEATRALPELLDALDIDNPVLFGHSDGASIALLHAALSARPVKALIVLAPHVFVEDLSITSIAAAKVTYETTDLRERLRRHHDDPDSAFRGWNDIWLHPGFRAWNIEKELAAIRCPILAIQGEDDEYGTMEQIDRIARGAVNAKVERMKLAHCGHSPHRDQPDAVIAATLKFLTAEERRPVDAANGDSRVAPAGN